MYTCRPCDFSLHISCSEMPQIINHPSHPLHSTLSPSCQNPYMLSTSSTTKHVATRVVASTTIAIVVTMIHIILVPPNCSPSLTMPTPAHSYSYPILLIRKHFLVKFVISLGRIIGCIIVEIVSLMGRG